ncbi:hypothetical protein ACLOJK_036856 [Asimina triloba]
MGCCSGVTAAMLDEMGFNPSGFGFLPFDGCGHLMLWPIEGAARQLPRMDAARCSAYGGNGGDADETVDRCLGMLLSDERPDVPWVRLLPEMLIWGRPRRMLAADLLDRGRSR